MENKDYGIKGCPYCGEAPTVEGKDQLLAVHFCKANCNNLMVVPLSVWQQRPIESALSKAKEEVIAVEVTRTQHLTEQLLLAGIGRTGEGNTLADLVSEACARYSANQEAGTILEELASAVESIAFRLSSVDIGTQFIAGIGVQDQVAVAVSEVRRLADLLTTLTTNVEAARQKLGR